MTEEHMGLLAPEDEGDDSRAERQTADVEPEEQPDPGNADD